MIALKSVSFHEYKANNSTQATINGIMKTTDASYSKQNKCYFMEMLKETCSISITFYLTRPPSHGRFYDKNLKNSKKKHK